MVMVDTTIQPSGPTISKRQAWFFAIRVPTLVAGFVPVLVGSALAFNHGSFAPLLAALALVVSIGIQIGTNLANDYWDFKKGADTAARIGPVRVTQAGLIPPSQTLIAMMAAFGTAALAGVAICALTSWLYLGLGVVCVACGFLYTAGPKPIAYIGLGELFAFVFFGVLATTVTYQIQTGQVSAAAWVCGSAIGAFAAALLAVNNLRDLATDCAAGKITLAVRFGRQGTKAQITGLLGGAFLLVLLLVVGRRLPFAALITWGAIPLLAPALKRVWRDDGSRPMHLIPALKFIARTELAFGVLLTLALLVS